jgi:hypothetical protein
MVGHGRHSTTERVFINYEGLAIQSLCKIQSGPFGNSGDDCKYTVKLFKIIYKNNSEYFDCINAVNRLMEMK